MRKFYFVPYAGGSGATFNSYKKQFAPNIDLVVMEFAGHGKRIMEDFFENMQQLCDDIYEKIKNDGERGEEYYIGGHCMGAAAAMAVAQKIAQEKEFNLPKAIIASGHGSFFGEKDALSQKSDREIVDFLVSEGGLFGESLNEEILELMIPIIRADSKIYEDFVFETSEKLPVDIAVLYSKNDKKTPASGLKEWLDYSSGQVVFAPFESNHYFVLHEKDKYINTVKKLDEYFAG